MLLFSDQRELDVLKTGGEPNESIQLNKARGKRTSTATSIAAKLMYLHTEVTCTG